MKKIVILCACLSVEHQAEGLQIAVLEPANEPNKPHIKGLFRIAQYLEGEEVGFEAQKGYSITLEEHVIETEETKELPKKVLALVTKAEDLAEKARTAREASDKAADEVEQLKKAANEAAEANEATPSPENEAALNTAIDLANKCVEEQKALNDKAEKAEEAAAKASEEAKKAIEAIEVKK